MVGGKIVDDPGEQVNIPEPLPADKGAEKFIPSTKILIGAEYIRYDGIQRSLHSDGRFIMKAKDPDHFVIESGKYDILIIDKISGGYGGKAADNILSQLNPHSKVILLSVSPEKESGMPENVTVLNLRDWDGLKNTVAEMEKSIRANRNK
ncbi:MAG: hypothetical protein V1744_04140 [Candidatus Altiarchaeota archaeon]